ncbi:MAG: hypothetical protein K0R02_618 [Rickettsiaceae bacterium]|jgi:hypothetical protein|nr:hypothetical protein [Rickettsiaceae bacterium]
MLNNTSNATIEQNLRMLRDPKGLARDQILSLVKETLKQLGYSGEDIAIFSDSIAEQVFCTQSTHKLS